jgi:hypothetical protein
MIARDALNIDILSELGYLTVAFGGLEDQIACFIGQLVNPAVQTPSRDLAFRMGFSKKCDTLWSLCQMRYAAANPALLKAMRSALDSCKSADTHRNNLVHGIFDYENGRISLTRRAKTTHSLTLGRIEEATAAVFEAVRSTTVAFTALWKLNRGEFPQTPEGASRTLPPQGDRTSDSLNPLDDGGEPRSRKSETPLRASGRSLP